MSTPDNTRIDMRGSGSALCILLAVSFAVFFPVLRNGFVLDDTYMVDGNEALRDLAAVPKLFASTPPGSINRGYYRPMMLASFALDRALFGPGPAAFHAVNIVWHAATAWLVFLLLRHLLGQWLASLLGGLLFLVHPVQGEVVYLITYRATALAVFFMLASLLYYLRHRHAFGVRQALAFALLFFASLASKEMGVILPFLMVACDALVRGQSRPAALAYVVTFVVLAAFATLRLWLCVPSSVSYFGAASGDRVLRAMLVVEAYVLSLLVAPRSLAATYDASVIHEPASFADPVLLASAGVLLGLCYLAWRLRARAPLVTLGIAWYFIALGPTYNIMRSPNLFGERFLYSAMFGFCLCVAYGIARLAGSARRPLAIAVLALALSLFAAQTHARAYDWRDEVSCWRAIVAARPDSVQAHVGMATTLLHARRYREALPHFEIALNAPLPSRATARPLFGEAATCYSHVGDLDRALAVVERWLSYQPEDTGFQQMRATLQAAIARRDRTALPSVP